MNDIVDLFFPSNFIQFLQDQYKKADKTKKPPHILAHVHAVFSSAKNLLPSGFLQYLQTGIFEPTYEDEWDYDANQQRFSHYHCTSIIPILYRSVCMDSRLNIEIVRYTGPVNIHEHGIPRDNGNAPHFALIVSNKISRRYLVDPFMDTVGPILEEGPGYLHIGPSYGRLGVRREYRSMSTVSKEDFAQMLYALREPGKSLDLLAAGQKLYDHHELTVHGSPANIAVWYNKDENTISTLLYLNQNARRDKAIYCDMKYDDDGNIVDTRLRLFFADELVWVFLKNPVFVAEMSFNELDGISALLQPQLYEPLKGKFQAVGSSLESLVSQLHGRLGSEREALSPWINMRTCYEHALAEEHVYPPEEREALLSEMKQRSKPIEKRVKHLLKRLESFAKLPEGQKIKWWEYMQLLRQWNTLNDQYNLFETEHLEKWRNEDPVAYHRVMDMTRFAQLHTTEDTSHIVAEQKLNSLLGYTALVADFIPYVVAQREMLQLLPFREDLAARIRARRAQYL